MIEKLKQLKEKSHMTNQQIAEKSNVPESTVARIFSGKTPNPTIATVLSMARAMGGSAADLINEDDGAKTSSETEDGSIVSSNDNEANASEQDVPPVESNPFDMKYYEDIINFYKNSLKKKDEWIARLFWCLLAIMAFILFILIFDILHPNFGFVKY